MPWERARLVDTIRPQMAAPSLMDVFCFRGLIGLLGFGVECGFLALDLHSHLSSLDCFSTKNVMVDVLESAFRARRISSCQRPGASRENSRVNGLAAMVQQERGTFIM